MRRMAVVLAVWMAVGAATAAQTIEGRVVGISDGDTLTLLTADREEVRVRLAEIDTPEAGQPYGTRARRALSDLAFRRDARVTVVDTDRYGRTVGRVHVGATDVNADLVQHGAAWVYLKYAKDPALFALERQARADRVGIWSLPADQQVPPWEWRHNGSAAAPIATLVAAKGGGANSSWSCGAKTKCGQMDSCEEAQFYLEQCGVRSLDRDKDGIPCESLCGG